MNARILTRSILGGCILALAFGTAAQATGSKASQTSAAAEKPAATSTTSGSGETAKATMHKHSQHHATSHSSSPTHHKHMASAPAAGNQETTYRAALKSCVEGPAGQRDSCLDNAIMRFGRS